MTNEEQQFVEELKKLALGHIESQNSNVCFARAMLYAIAGALTEGGNKPMLLIEARYVVPGSRTHYNRVAADHADAVAIKLMRVCYVQQPAASHVSPRPNRGCSGASGADRSASSNGTPER